MNNSMSATHVADKADGGTKPSRHMRIMRIYEAPEPTAENICFVSTWWLTTVTKQIFQGAFWQKSLIFPHNPHAVTGCLTNKVENMRIMRMYEGR